MTQYQENEDKLIAAICHLSGLIFMFGAITPLVIWVTQKDRSETIRFHALQTIAVQTAVILLYMLGMGCYMLSIFAFIPFSAMMVETSSTPEASPLIFIPIAIIILIFGIMCLAGPAYLIMIVVAAVRTLQGHDFRYPLIGSWIYNNYIAPPTAVPE